MDHSNEARIRTVRPHNVRQPVSCEPCRRRKIKCSRTRPPCETCRRRGCASSCFYTGSRDYTQYNNNSTFNKELLDRVASLEMQLEKYSGANIDASSNAIGERKEDRDVHNTILSPPEEPTAGTPQYNAMPESISSPSTSSRLENAPPTPRNTGVLTTLPNGNVHYSPQISQWNSVLVNTNFAIELPSLDDADDSPPADVGFPFSASASSISIDGLLSILPPTRQCTYLKDMYFSVLSPVSFT